jgi:hypothetical protein
VCDRPLLLVAAGDAINTLKCCCCRGTFCCQVLLFTYTCVAVFAVVLLSPVAAAAAAAGAATHLCAGFPREHNWVLHGPENDRTLGMRNWLAYNLARRMGRYASRTRYFELFLNTVSAASRVSNAFVTMAAARVFVLSRIAFVQLWRSNCSGSLQC